MNLTYKRAHKYFSYNAKTGALSWKIRVGHSTPGLLVGYITPNGYVFRIKGKAFPVHRVIWLMEYGSWPKHRIRHLNGNVFDNRLSNLKDANRKEIIRHSKLQIDNKSGVTGVSWNEDAGKWEAKIRVDGVQTYLGLFPHIKEAALARKNAESFYWNLERIA